MSAAVAGPDATIGDIAIAMAASNGKDFLIMDVIPSG
jgi:hypothetical protein